MFQTLFLLCLLPSFAYSNKNNPSSNLQVVNYVNELLDSFVDSNFRGSWVIDPQSAEQIKKNTKRIKKIFSGISKVKIGYAERDVKVVLGNPVEKRSKGRIWIYGKPLENGSYEDLIQIFFSEGGKVLGIISHSPSTISEDIAVNIGDPIEKVINSYGEPEDEKDYFEDPDNKQYLGMYYLYPKSGIGFLIGQNDKNNNLSVQGVIIFGKT